MLAEIADPQSRDWGTGEGFAGLVVGLAQGEAYRPTLPTSLAERIELTGGEVLDDSTYTPTTLRAHLATQGQGRGRVVWTFEVEDSDILGFAGRVYGGWVRTNCLADGVVLRPGARVYNLRKEA